MYVQTRQRMPRIRDLNTWCRNGRSLFFWDYSLNPGTHGTKHSDLNEEAEMEVDGDVLQEENAETQSPKRKVIRVESEETQDNVCDSLAISREEAEEMSFVPSAHLLVRQSMQ